jgi:hypothetical protein
MTVYKKVLLATFMVVFSVGAFACDGHGKSKEKEKSQKPAERSLSL